MAIDFVHLRVKRALKCHDSCNLKRAKSYLVDDCDDGVEMNPLNRENLFTVVFKTARRN